MNKFYKKEIITEDGECAKEKIVQFYNPFKDKRGYNFRYKSVTIKSYLDSELPESFTDNECGKLYRLSKIIYSDSNLIAKRTNNSIVPMSKADIQTFLKMHRNQFNPFWKKILLNKIIKPVVICESTYFCFNPLYYNTTHYLPLYLFIAFQDELKEHLPEWVIKKYLDMKSDLGYEETAK